MAVVKVVMKLLKLFNSSKENQENVINKAFPAKDQVCQISVCSKVSICNYVTCHMLHVTCRMSHVTCLMSNAYVDRRDMLNNFCFHVYAQMSLLMGENVNDFFWTSPPLIVTNPIIELVPS